MDSKQETYEVEFTEECIEEINEIYSYISINLFANKAAKELMKKIKINILNLEQSPRMYTKINGVDRLKRNYRRMVINNYVILYTIDDDKKKVYISHMYYGKINYLD